MDYCTTNKHHDLNEWKRIKTIGVIRSLHNFELHKLKILFQNNNYFHLKIIVKDWKIAYSNFNNGYLWAVI